MREAAASARILMRNLVDTIRTEDPDNKALLNIVYQIRFAEDVQYKFFLACLQLYLSDYLVWPGALAERVVDLTQYAARVRSARAVQYLARVSRCYLYGMVAELAVMSRATLQAILEDAIPEDHVRSLRRIPKHLRVGLADYIEVASGTLLSETAAAAAWKIKQIGDDAAHVSAEMVKDATIILDNLVVVLKAIEDR
jgi:hypothetical protein